MVKKTIRNTFLDDLQNHRIITIKIRSIQSVYFLFPLILKLLTSW